ncbi:MULTISPECIES: hypothetical protein [Paenibacillus]|uniref:hypothetical protein n=1 Tax=Paenibacillus TaxID=44249 RepID=UPI0022B8CDE5|nr:hypothetical protein [Paenibacillus caseinilyticus]MCZ8518200.1 hypothetical protein [Paenibacillus caseinilyticus]
MPGFGQLLNGKYFKGIILIVLEVIINVQAHLNRVIQLSFQGDIAGAVAETNYQWLLFYPCVYMFGIWDAYRDSRKDPGPLLHLPFVCAAFFSTVGLIYSPFLLGPVWLPILFCFLGVAVGLVLRKWLPSAPE